MRRRPGPQRDPAPRRSGREPDQRTIKARPGGDRVESPSPGGRQRANPSQASWPRLVGKGDQDFGQHALLFSGIARQEMKGLDPAHSGFARDQPGCDGRQVRALSSKNGVSRGKDSLNEQNVGASSEANDRRAIGWRVGGVGDIGDLLAGCLRTLWWSDRKR